MRIVSSTHDTRVHIVSSTYDTKKKMEREHNILYLTNTMLSPTGPEFSNCDQLKLF